MFFNAQRGVGTQDATLGVSMRCPACRHLGMFEINQPTKDLTLVTTTRGQEMEQLLLGHRICPNNNCRNHVFVVLTKKGGLVESFPQETIDFDSTDLPANVVAALEEAIKCSANRCWVAAAMLIRKTLEALCDHQDIKGDSLKKRVIKLGNSSIVPDGLTKGVDNLRLLGNDAAHVECKDYDKIEENEIDVSLEFTKELLKAVYQYSGLVKKLEALKATT